MDRAQSRYDIPASKQGPALARRLVCAELDGWGLDHLTADVQLLVSEMVTNAYQHSAPTDTFEVELSANEERVRVSVADDSVTQPTMREPNPGRSRGRGLQLVNGIASHWGAENYRDGKRVWAEVARQPLP